MYNGLPAWISDSQIESFAHSLVWRTVHTQSHHCKTNLIKAKLFAENQWLTALTAPLERDTWRRQEGQQPICPVHGPFTLLFALWIVFPAHVHAVGTHHVPFPWTPSRSRWSEVSYVRSLSVDGLVSTASFVWRRNGVRFTTVLVFGMSDSQAKSRGTIWRKGGRLTLRGGQGTL